MHVAKNVLQPNTQRLFRFCTINTKTSVLFKSVFSCFWGGKTKVISMAL